MALFRLEHGRFLVEVKRNVKAESLLFSDGGQILLRPLTIISCGACSGRTEPTNGPISLPVHPEMSPVAADRTGAVWYQKKGGIGGRIFGGRDETIGLEAG